MVGLNDIFHRRLSVWIAAVVLGSVLLVEAVFLYFLHAREETELLAEMTARGELIAEALLHAGPRRAEVLPRTGGYWFGEPALVGIQVLRPDGRVLLAEGEAPEGGGSHGAVPVLDRDAHRMHLTRRVGGDRGGAVHLSFDTTPMERELEAHALGIGAALVLVAFSITAIVLLGLRTRILSPLSRLQRDLAALVAADPDVPPAHPGDRARRDRLGELFRLVDTARAQDTRRRSIEAAVAAGTDLLLAIDDRNVVTEASANCEALLGLPPEDLIGQPLVSLAADDRLAAWLAPPAPGEREQRVELELRDTRGVAVPVAITAGSRDGGAPASGGMVCLVRARVVVAAGADTGADAAPRPSRSRDRAAGNDARRRLAAPPGGKKVRARRQARAPATKAGFLEGLRVLVAEDHPVNQEVTRGMLRLLGCDATICDDGRAAVDRAGEETFDVVLMDWQMPVLDGLGATELIRQGACEPATRASVPIVAMTANALPGDREQCLHAGMSGYLSKPFSCEDLNGILTDALARTPSTAVVTAEPIAPGKTAGDEPASARADPIGELPAIDDDVIASVVALDAGAGGLLARLVCAFQDSAREDVSALVAAMKERSAESLRKNAHRLKSSSGNVGAVRLASLCETLETAARAGQLENCPGVVEVIAEEFERACLELGQRLEAA